jgi:hypothetical protein
MLRGTTCWNYLLRSTELVQFSFFIYEILPLVSGPFSPVGRTVSKKQLERHTISFSYCLFPFISVCSCASDNSMLVSAGCCRTSHECRVGTEKDFKTVNADHTKLDTVGYVYVQYK